MKTVRCRGFTLTELLVVIVVILVLSAILLKVVAVVREKWNRSVATATLEKIQNALGEYFNKHGEYPPVNFMAYEFESGYPAGQSQSLSTWLAAHDDPDKPAEFFPDTNTRKGGWPVSANPDWSLGYRYGLGSYLWKRDQGGQVHWYDQDGAKGVQEKDGWANCLKEVPLTYGMAVHTSPPSMGFTTIWTNRTMTVLDPWGAEYQYQSPPPHHRYRIWSMGPDGVTGTGDDIARDAFNE